MGSSRSVRTPAVAGMFYPEDPNVLARTVDALLAGAAAERPGTIERPRVLVAPHAGYTYSGAVAARAFALLDDSFHTVVLVGPSHVDAFDFTSVYDGDGYETPLGVLEVDRAAARRIAANTTTIRISDRGHVAPRHARGEHGLEVMLPFLQRVCGSPRIVPVVMGSQDWGACAELGRALAETAERERVLIVASSDLSHFYSYDDAVRLDTAFCELLATGDAERLYEGVRAGRCEACGAGPVVASLVAANTWSDRRCRVLARINSGDVTGDRTRVVGYASAVVTASSRLPA
ncbi:MAG TPA: AmmeMemoRadiSam system protein B [Candidatus Krumholzibacteria bacterium]|nr:AmmeMemoRadiSam system protein B [Candidatus Krumholzibacteria bacterium]